MALTKKERSALTMARAHISLEREHYICHALWAVGLAAPHLEAAARRIENYIMDQLGNEITLGGWQHEKRIVPRHAQTRAQLRADRLAWIDWMLDEKATAPRPYQPRIEAPDGRERTATASTRMRHARALPADMIVGTPS